MRRLSSIVLVIALAACGDSLSVSNTSPKGSVGGLVVDASSRAAIANASVTLIAGGQVFDPVVTGADGTFQFTSVPFGNVLVLVAAPEGAAFGGATIAGVLAGNAGDFPVGNEALTLGPIGLVPTATEAFRFRVLDERGKPVDGYEVGASTTVEWVDFSGGVGQAVGERIFVTTTDASGYASIPGLPLYHRLSSSVNDAVIVSLPPYDADDDGAYEFAGGLHVFNMLALADPSPDVILDPGYLTQLQVQASTIGALEGGAVGPPVASVIAPQDSVFIKFNLPIQSSATAWLVSETGAPLASPFVTVEGDTMELTFAALAPGAEYNLSVHVVAKVGDRIVQGDFGAPFFTSSTAPEVDATLTREGSIIRVTFSEPVGTGDPSTNTLDGANCVLFFASSLGNGSTVGDDPGELGHSSCDIGRPFTAEEPDPGGPVGRSGYSTQWTFQIPVNPITGVEVPVGSPVHILFSHVQNTNLRIERADGRAVTDFTGTMRAKLIP